MQQQSFIQRYTTYIKFLLVGCLIAVAFVFVQNVSAQTVDLGLQQAQATGLSGADPRVIISRIIQVSLGFLGLVAIVITSYGGYMYMTAAGNPDRVERAKTILRNGLIGLVIILSAFGIVSFIIGRLTGSGAPGGGGFFGGGNGGSTSGSSGFPLGVIDSHYPDQGQTNVARNTSIIVTFTRPIDIASVVNDNGTPNNPDDDTINQQSVKILRASDDSGSGPFVGAAVSVSEDARTFVFQPNDYLGTPEENIDYKVVLEESILLQSGKPAFGSFGAYEWQFEVGTFIDTEPPIVEKFIPSQDANEPRNVVIQIQFNEAMNPITVGGDVLSGFDNLSVKTASGESVEGRFEVSNQYRTVEFITNDLCGQNSCGQDVFCLPGNQDLTVLIRAATVGNLPPTASFPLDGVTDVASNSLDGNVDGTATGSPDDNVTWSFSTTNEIDLTPPVIESVSPDPFAVLVPKDAPVNATFSKPVLSKTVNRSTVSIDGVDSYTIRLDSRGTRGIVQINHSDFTEDTNYTPSIASGVKDIYQNCFQPCVGP